MRTWRLALGFLGVLTIFSPHVATGQQFSYGRLSMLMWSLTSDDRPYEGCTDTRCMVAQITAFFSRENQETLDRFWGALIQELDAISTEDKDKLANALVFELWGAPKNTPFFYTMRHLSHLLASKAFQFGNLLTIDPQDTYARYRLSVLWIRSGNADYTRWGLWYLRELANDPECYYAVEAQASLALFTLLADQRDDWWEDALRQLKVLSEEHTPRVKRVVTEEISAHPRLHPELRNVFLAI